VRALQLEDERAVVARELLQRLDETREAEKKELEELEEKWKALQAEQAQAIQWEEAIGKQYSGRRR
jgi:hypothetical protein